MGWFEKAISTFSSDELELLKTRPPTHESLAKAAELGMALGNEAYPGDLVIQSVQYEGNTNFNWPAQVTNIAAQTAYDRMQRRI